MAIPDNSYTVQRRMHILPRIDYNHVTHADHVILFIYYFLAVHEFPLQYDRLSQQLRSCW